MRMRSWCCPWIVVGVGEEMDSVIEEKAYEGMKSLQASRSMA